MAVNFNIQFRINATTRVIRLTDNSSGFTYGKGCFYIAFPDGSVRNLPDFANPDITSAGNNYIDIPCVTDINNNVITGAYTISYAVIDNAANSQGTSSKPFDFNWIEPSNGITNLSDVIIPEVVFSDVTSYSPIGSFTGTLSRTLSSSFPSTSEASGNSPITSTVSNTITVVSATNYYEGSYTPTSAVSITYTHSTNSWLTIAYSRTFSKTFSIKKCPNQLELVTKINNYRAIIDAYKETNDTQFNILSEQYDLVIGLYSHLIARYSTNTQDGSEPILRELLSILEPYTGTYTYQSTKMLPFELTSSGTNSFNISDGTNTDAVQLGSTLTFSSGNASLIPIVTNNVVTYSPTFGTTLNTFAQGNDSRFHNPVTIGTANGLSISTQALSLAAATSGSAGAMSASDKTKLDGIASGATANVGTVTSVALTVPAAFSVTGSPITTSGTLVITAGGTSAQYITGAGALATLNTANVPENTNLYFTTARARTSISLTTTGTTGAATYDNATGILNIPSYIGGVTSFNTRTGAIVLSSADVTTALTYTPVPSNRTLTINGTSYDLSADRSWSIAAGVTSFNTRTGAIVLSGTDVTTALTYTPENAANKGIANGYASLDGGGLVPSTQLPSYVDDVLEYTNLASFPVSGTTGKIYVALDTNKIYRWSGATYIEVSPTIGTIWGGITGTLSNQTDLQNALNLKYNTPTGTTAQYVAGDGSLIAFPVAGQSGTIVRLVRNQSGATLTKGTVVYISGATGNNPIVSKAIATGDTTSAQTFGLCQADIANNATGYVVVMGDLIGLDTSAFTEGQQVYLSGTVAGTFTATKQYAPIHLVYIGIITRSHPTLGQIEVKIQNGYELDELHDVSAQSPANNDIIAFNTTSGLWEKKSIATTLGYTPSNDSLVVHLAGTETITGQKTFNPTVTAASAIARGTNLTPTLVASANSDVLVGLDINPTFTNGSFTNVYNYGLRVNGKIFAGGGTLEIGRNANSGSANQTILYADAFETTLMNNVTGARIAFRVNGTDYGRFLPSGNLTLQNGGTFTDAGYRLDVNGTARIQNALTLSGSVTGVGNLSNYTVTASSGSAKSKSITSTLIASANGDVLVGLDINPTFTNGGFTGVQNVPIRVNSGSKIGVLVGSQTNFYLASNETAINSPQTNGVISLQLGGNNYGRFLATTGNFLLQNGGAFTDAGFRLDVAGTTRFQGTTASDTAPLGSELAGVTGTGTNWVLASGATNLNVGGYTHTVGSTTALTTSLAAVVGTYYQITYTITGRTAGSITIAYGGTSTFPTATGASGPRATATTALIITPTTDFDGTIVLSIKSISQSSASSTFANSSGTSIVEIRANSSNTNTFIGLNSGSRITTGINNIFIGTNVGANNTTGTNNTFLGYLSGNSNTIGAINTFFGLNTGYNNTTASNNSFFGGNAGLSNTTGENNTFVGASAGQLNSTGGNNTFIGTTAGYSNTTSISNSFFGNAAGYFNTTGVENTNLGSASGYNNITGSNNVFFGRNAGRYISDGSTANAITDNSIYIGHTTKALANNQTNQIVIGYQTTGLGSNTTVLGNSSTLTTAIYGSLLLGTTSTTASALLSMVSTTQGFLQPVMTTTQKNAIASPATGLSVYDSTVNTLSFYNGSSWSLVNNPSARNVQDFTATASQTTFTVTNGYIVGLIDVYVNGSKLTSSEFTATNGTTFVLTVASTVGDQVQSINYTASVNGISGAGTANYVPKFTASGTIGNSSIQDLTTGVLVSNSVTATSAIARGTNLTPTLVASANSDVLVGLDINPTFTNGSFTGVANTALRVLSASGNQLILGYNTSNQSVFSVASNGHLSISNGSNVLNLNGIGLYNISLLSSAGNGATDLPYTALSHTFSTSGTVKAKIFNTGNFTLQNGGTFTDAGYRLEVVGTARVTTSAYFATTSGSVGIGNTNGTVGTLNVTGRIALTSSLFFSSNLTSEDRWEINVATPANDLYFSRSGLGERMRITSAGNVGIGTSSPTDYGSNYKVLEINGTISGVLNITSNTTLIGQIAGGTNDFYIEAKGGSTNLRFIANGSERMRIGSAGLVTITSLVSTYTTAQGANMYVNPADGAISRSTSSIKYKTDVLNYDKGLDIVNQLRPVYYKGINDGDKIFAGLIAEEVHDLGLTEFVQYAEDETPDSLSYQNMVTLAFKAIQELSAKVTLLENK